MTRVFSGFHNPLSRQDLITLAIFTFLAGALYLLVSALVFKIGFPLDDSWIHLTFARNLAILGEWSFRPGLPSAGSTSPLWSALLSIGFLFNLAPYVWTYLLGLSVMWALSVICEFTARRMVNTYSPTIPWIGLFIIAEWHLLWAAMSGMETLLHGLIATVVLAAIMMNSRRYLTLGLLTGLSVWVRPDGLTLLAPLGLAVLFLEEDTPSRLRGLLRALIGFGAVFLFYLLFNLLVGGAPMPNTFYAKQAEYAVWQTFPLTQRLGELLLQLLVGPSILLIPGMIKWVIRSVRARAWGALLALAWSVGYMLLYLMRLPMYQHGRYIMPAMPVFFLMGLLAVAEFASSRSLGRYDWFVNTLWRVSLGALTLLFVGLGAITYARDVALIEQEMVAPAKWAAANLPPDAVIAAHDIGALGYFDTHRLLDLAGLVSPEVIPFIRDEARLAVYLDQKNANYLIAFADLYKKLPLGRQVVFVSDGFIVAESNFAPMTIYRWK
ncbi:MAG: hypothetical protein HXY38_14755 [Chloroflexi bacterium]|nr:hypothetical protein [Chloroflexota bacterium]